MKWTIADQCLFDCVSAGLRGLNRLGWISAFQYEQITSIIQFSIDEKARK